MQTITTQELRDAFADAIEAIVPKMAHEAGSPWLYTPSERSLGRPLLKGTALRSFDLVFGPGMRSRLWQGGIGSAWKCELQIHTSYRGVPADLLDHAIVQDAVDLDRALARLRDPTVPGFCDAVMGPPRMFDVDDEGNAVVAHVFEIHYHQSTA